MMAGKSKPARSRIARVSRSSWAFYDVLQGTIVLDEIEVGGGYVFQRDALIAGDGYGFQENLGQYYRGTPIEIGTAVVHFGDERTEEAKVMK